MESQDAVSVPSTRPRQKPLAKIVLFALLFAVAGLATMAKNGQYFPETSSAHNVSVSTKMNVAHSSVQFTVDDLRAVTRLFSLQPPMRAKPAEQSTAAPPIIQLCLTDSKPLRAPPSSRL
jgi:hypothetical protein